MSKPINIKELEEVFSNEEIIRYLSGDATESERKKIEAAINQSDFFKDAIQGLASIPDPNQSINLLQDIHGQLAKHLQRKKRKNQKLGNPFWSIIAIITLLLLIIVVYLAIQSVK